MKRKHTIKYDLSAITAMSLLLMAAPALAEQSHTLILKAIGEYQKGNYDKAAALLATDLRENPDNGLSHYYLGLVQKRLGQDVQALGELEMAARQLQPEMVEALTREAMDKNQDILPKIPVLKQPREPNWFEWVGAGWNQMVTGKTESGDPAPDFMDSLEDMYRQSKRWVKSIGKDPKKAKKKQYTPTYASSMPLEDMLELVNKSRKLNNKSWASHPDGLAKYRQAPENTREWDFWINRFTRAFQYILLKHLAKEGGDHLTGSAACIFSIDKTGRLRGHIYASTADSVLNRCLLATIKEMNYSRILEFPGSSKIDGFNFRMTWNYGRLLRYIRAVRLRREAMERQALAQLQTKVESKTTSAQVKGQEKRGKKIEEKKAIARRLPPAKPGLKEKITTETEATSVKTAVLAEILPPPRPLELEAVALSLSDVPMPKNAGTRQGDVFKNIDDRAIMAWPDLNR